MTADHFALAAALPDVPRWLETRWLLRTPRTRLVADADGHVAVNRAEAMGAVVGRPGADVLRRALRGAPRDTEVLVQDDAADEAGAALPGWRVVGATLHRLSAPVEAPAAPDAVVATALALSLAGDEVAAVCTAGAVTETLWDVGIDTIAGHRRRGHATAAFRALAGHLAARGLQPVWGAEDDNAASLRLAAKLGFQPAGHLAVVKR
jgi:RimJ/RimL family protein N-acetyltransferase